jgi:hypothetical protein
MSESVVRNLKFNIDLLTTHLGYLIHKKEDTVYGRDVTSHSANSILTTLYNLDGAIAYTEDRIRTVEGILWSINDTDDWTDSTLSTIKALSSGILGKAGRTVELGDKMNAALDELSDSIGDMHYSDRRSETHTDADLKEYTDAYKCVIDTKDIPDAGRGRVADRVHLGLDDPAVVCAPVSASVPKVGLPC